jgi:hypothetical protein
VWHDVVLFLIGAVVGASGIVGVGMFWGTRSDGLDYEE